MIRHVISALRDQTQTADRSMSCSHRNAGTGEFAAFPEGTFTVEPADRGPPVGTAARRAAATKTTIVEMTPVSARTPNSRDRAARSGNADLWAVLPVGPGTAARRAAATKTTIVEMIPVSARTPNSQDRTARQGTPTSGQFSRWGPAQRPAGPRRRRPQSSK